MPPKISLSALSKIHYKLASDDIITLTFVINLIESMGGRNWSMKTNDCDSIRCPLLNRRERKTDRGVSYRLRKNDIYLRAIFTFPLIGLFCISYLLTSRIIEPIYGLLYVYIDHNWVFVHELIWKKACDIASFSNERERAKRQ